MFVVTDDLLEWCKQVHLETCQRNRQDPERAKELDERRAEREQAVKDGRMDPLTKIFLDYMTDGVEASKEEIAKAHEENDKRLKKLMGKLEEKT